MTADYWRSFETGEIDPHLLLRQDQDFVRNSCERLRNAWLKTGGSARRKPGELALYEIGTDQLTTTRKIVLNGTPFELIFRTGEIRIRREDGSAFSVVNNSLVLNYTTPLEVSQIRVVPLTQLSVLLVFGGGTTKPHRLQWNGDLALPSWSLADFAFLAQEGQPLWRFEDTLNITLTPQGYTGFAQTVTASSALFNTNTANGEIWSLNGRKVRTTGYTSSTIITVDILEDLYPAVAVFLDTSTSGDFNVGDIVQGSESGIRGVIISLPSTSTVHVQLTNSYTNFESGSSASEDLVGPTASARISQTVAATVISTPPALEDWHQPLMSRATPRAVDIVDRRLCLAGFRQSSTVTDNEVGGLMVISAVDDVFDFDVGTEAVPRVDDADPIQLILEPKSEEILHVVGAEQAHVFTTDAVYYLPYTDQTPLTPANAIANGFRLIDSQGSSEVCAPELVQEGVVYASSVGSRIKVSRAQRTDRASWAVNTISLLSQHLISDPQQLVVIEGAPDSAAPGGYEADRHLLILNADGTVAVMKTAFAGDDVAGWALWESHNSTADYISLSHRDGVTGAILRMGTQYRFCRLTFDAFMMGEYSYDVARTEYDGQTCTVMEDGFAIGSGLVTAGEVAGIAPATGRTIGMPRAFEAWPIPRWDVDDGWAPWEYGAVYAHCLDTQGLSLDYRKDDGTFSPEAKTSYGPDDDVSTAPPKRTCTFVWDSNISVEEGNGDFIQPWTDASLRFSDKDASGSPQMQEITLLAVTADRGRVPEKQRNR